MFCPQCKAEYRIGFTRCSDCQVDLVDHFPPEQSTRAPETHTTFEADPFAPEHELVVIRTYQNGLDVDFAKSVLEAAGIESMIRGNDTRSRYYPVIQGIDLLVRAEDAEDADKILNIPSTTADDSAE